MRVLITGGAGFIGSHTVDAMLARGHAVRVVDRLEPPVHRPGRHDLPPQVEVTRGDVSDREVMRRALRDVEIVYHLAAYQDYLTDFSHFFLTNTVSTALIYELIVTQHLPIQRVIVASSQAVYGEGRYRCPTHGLFYPASRSPEALAARHWEIRCAECECVADPDWVDESFSRPHNSYGLSKRDQEDIALTLGARYGIPSVALRYSIVQGPRQSFRNAYSGALRSFAVRLLHGQPAVIFEDGRQLRDYVSVHDVVRANILALEHPAASGRVFNVGSGRAVAVRELAEIVARAVGSSLEPLVPGLYRVGDTRHVLSDISRLRALGWEVRVSQAEMVSEYIAWAREQPDLRDTYTEAEARMRALGVLRKARANK